MFWVEAKVLKDKWSFDAAVGYAMRNSLFVRNEMVCTKTLYNYLHQGLLRVKASDVKETLESWLQSLETVSDISALCKIITADNGREFADIDISTLENEDLSIFFAHPYSPGERGSNERHNELLLRKVRLLKMYPKLLYNVPLIGVTIYLASCYITKHHKKSLLKKLIRLWI
ncbi:MAG: hypothetical protein MR282_02235 [Veillonella caviae]|nr:hypothetical protein [Veillonella caviae]MCI5708287.1 hypothetical protein [Veillonella caviae]